MKYPVSVKKGEKIILAELLLKDSMDIRYLRDKTGLDEQKRDKGIENRANWMSAIMRPRNCVRNFWGTASNSIIHP